MRSWNEDIMNFVIAEIRFAIYQWGVETNTTRNMFCQENRVRNLPMRSWNCGEDCGWWGMRMGSQFTNEELKRLLSFYHYFPCGWFAIYQWGVETLLLFHNRTFLLQFAIYQWGVETRQPQFNTFALYHLVRNLPMRSWNESGGHHLQRWVSLAIYQWGVETYYDEIRRQLKG